MTYRIAFKKSVSRDLRKLDRSDAKRGLDKLEAELPERAEACPPLKGKFAGPRELRVGDYRVVFAIVGDTVLSTRISHRRDAYRQ